MSERPASAQEPRLGPPVSWPSLTVAWYAVAMLAAANALSLMARTILSLLVDPVKADLGVSDTAISLLHGFSFAVVFAVMGLPLSRLADRGNRRNIIAASIFAWSVATLFCGLARNYTMLLVGRLGAGAGEGGFGPASQAILADYFPREKLPLAMAVYGMGIFVGSGAALMMGGAILQWTSTTGPVALPLLGIVKGWQIAFMGVGLPGILLAMLFLTVPEPVRRETAGDVPTIDKVKLGEVYAHLASHPLAYLGLLLGFGLHVLVGFGAAAWSPAYLGRHFAMSPFQIGTIYGPLLMASGIVGALAGGMLGNRLVARGVLNGNAWIAFVCYGLEVLFGIAYAAATTPMRTWICIAGMNVLSSAAFGAGFAVLNEITPNRMRAQVGALFLVSINVIGAGLGPTLVAVAAEKLFITSFALAQSIALVSAIIGLPAIALLWLTVRFYPMEVTQVPRDGRWSAT